MRGPHVHNRDGGDNVISADDGRLRTVLVLTLSRVLTAADFRMTEDDGDLRRSAMEMPRVGLASGTFPTFFEQGPLP